LLAHVGVATLAGVCYCGVKVGYSKVSVVEVYVPDYILCSVGHMYCDTHCCRVNPDLCMALFLVQLKTELVSGCRNAICR